MHRRGPLLAVIAMLATLTVVTPAPAQRAPAPAVTASAAPHPAQAPKVEGAAEVPAAHVLLHDRRVFSVQRAFAGRTAEQRAQAATQALQRVSDEPEAREVRLEPQGDVVVIFVGATPIIHLSADDAAAAGDASLAVHGAAVAGKTREALRAERQRAAIARSVFSFSLLVFSGLLAFLLLRKLDELVDRLRGWLKEHPDRLPALHVRGIEVVRPAAVRGGVTFTLTIAKATGQVAIAYGWLIIALSLFESTRGYTERLTGFVLKPLSELMGRVASALPLVVIAVITAAVVGGALRFMRLFFGSVERGETTLGWLPRDLAPATSILVRAGVVVVTLVVAAPLITGTDDGAISRVGAVALGAIGLAGTPLLATAAAGIAVMFGRKLRVGEHAVVAGRACRVRATTLLQIVLEDDEGGAIHVPHLAVLWHPTHILGPAAALRVEVAVAASADLKRALEALEQAAATIGPRPRVELESLAGGAAHFAIRVQPEAPAGARSRLLCAVAATLSERGIALGSRTS
jgi:small-conductance mechanosensitive channel